MRNISKYYLYLQRQSINTTNIMILIEMTMDITDKLQAV